MNHADLNLLDEAVIAELREVMEDEFNDLVDGFVSDLPVQLDLLEAAVVQQSANDIYRIAHKLKSSCGTIGAPRLTNQVLQLELAGRQNVLEQTPELMQRARAITRETIAALEGLRE